MCKNVDEFTVKNIKTFENYNKYLKIVLQEVCKDTSYKRNRTVIVDFENIDIPIVFKEFDDILSASSSENFYKYNIEFINKMFNVSKPHKFISFITLSPAISDDYRYFSNYRLILIYFDTNINSFIINYNNGHKINMFTHFFYLDRKSVV